MKRNYPDIGLHVPSLLLPAPHVPLESWPVIACDQHTSEPEYWREAERLVGDRPSTLRLVLPEANLAGDRQAAVAEINERMAAYIERGVLQELPPGFMLVERHTGRATARRGLLVALDLQHFDYRADAQTLIRSTEGTDANRLPARIDVRREAVLEVPHILVLIDDPECSVIEPLFGGGHDALSAGDPLYDIELPQGGGHVRGWHMANEQTIAKVAQAIGKLRRGEPPLLYAMGDGNHSFAAARSVWEDLRAEGAANDHPGRYATVELVNLHDPALHFAPIHRLVAGVQPATLLTALAEHLRAAGLRREICQDRESWLRLRHKLRGQSGHCIPYVAGRGQADAEFGVITIAAPRLRLATASLQDFLDAFSADAKDRRGRLDIDFIHGDETLEQLAQAPNNTGFLLPPMDKHDLFPTVISDGATPRKTFSLGEAHEKRYYFECRRIRP